jgi:hypothetical protein
MALEETGRFPSRRKRRSPAAISRGAGTLLISAGDGIFARSSSGIAERLSNMGRVTLVKRR